MCGVGKNEKFRKKKDEKLFAKSSDQLSAI